MENTVNAWGPTPVDAWNDQVVLSLDAIYGNSDDLNLGSLQHTGTLTKGENYQANAQVLIPGNLKGAYVLFIATDSSNQVYEYSHEGNNVSAPLPVTINNADLTATAVNTPANGAFGATPELSWTVKNLGDVSTWENWHDGIWLSRDAVLGGDDIRLDTVQASTNPLAANGEYTRTVQVAVPMRADFATGDYYLLVNADEFNNQGEANENNNVHASGLIHLTRPQFDLQARHLTVEQTSIRSGGPLTIQWDDYNDGADPITGSFYDRVYLHNVTTGETLLDTVVYFNNAQIGAAQGLARSYAFTLPEGERGVGILVIQVVSDYYDAIVETNGTGDAETNNTTTLELISQLASYPDLVVGALDVPLAAKAGETVTLSWTVTNQGSKAATGDWAELIALPLGTSAQDRPLFTFKAQGQSIVPGQSVQRMTTVTLPFDLDGSLLITAVVDARNAVVELDEANNRTVSGQGITIAPALTLSLDTTSVAENAGTNALIGIITRSGDTTVPLNIGLTADVAGLLLPVEVSIPAGENAASFAVGTIADGLVGPTRHVIITATAEAYDGVSTSLDLVNADRPTLTVSLPTPVANEGDGALAASVYRNTATDTPLTVRIGLDKPWKAAAPAELVFAIGQSVVSLPLMLVNDTVVEGTRELHVTATAAGLATGSAPLTILDNDAPNLTLSLSQTSVAESAGAGASTLTVTRDGITDQTLDVVLSGDATQLRLPARLSFSSGKSSITMPVSVFDNANVEGDRLVLLGASVADAVLSTAIPGTYRQIGLQILDDDGPGLRLSLGRNLIGEDATTTATVHRNTGTLGDLLVSVASGDTTEATTPATVLIQDGQDSASFIVAAVLDGLSDGTQNVTLMATAAGFSSAASGLKVTDRDLSDLQVTGIVLPDSSLTGQYAEQQRPAGSDCGRAHRWLSTRPIFARLSSTWANVAANYISSSKPTDRDNRKNLPLTTTPKLPACKSIHLTVQQHRQLWTWPLQAV